MSTPDSLETWRRFFFSRGVLRSSIYIFTNMLFQPGHRVQAGSSRCQGNDVVNILHVTCIANDHAVDLAGKLVGPPTAVMQHVLETGRIRTIVATHLRVWNLTDISMTRQCQLEIKLTNPKLSLYWSLLQL